MDCCYAASSIEQESKSSMEVMCASRRHKTTIFNTKDGEGHSPYTQALVDHLEITLRRSDAVTANALTHAVSQDRRLDKMSSNYHAINEKGVRDPIVLRPLRLSNRIVSISRSTEPSNQSSGTTDRTSQWFTIRPSVSGHTTLISKVSRRSLRQLTQAKRQGHPNSMGVHRQICCHRQRWTLMAIEDHNRH